MTVRACRLPSNALLRRYDCGGGYTDCYEIEISGQVALCAYVNAFYTSWLFKIERAILSLVGQPSTNHQAAEIASGKGVTFAAWNVEAREEDQLLLCDITARTRSWFMVILVPDRVPPKTRLFFGSAITSIKHQTSRREGIGLIFGALIGFHKLYSRALLAAGTGELQRLNEELKS